jgi:MFS family permease
MLMTGPVLVIALTMVMSIAMQKMAAFRAVTLGTLISAVAWIFLIVHPTVLTAYCTLAVVALGEITLSPRYYDYVSRLAPPGQQGTYLGFAFLPIGIGSIIGGPFGGMLIHYFGEIKHQPERIWWVVTAVGLMTALLLWIYDRMVTPKEAAAKVVS